MSVFILVAVVGSLKFTNRLNTASECPKADIYFTLFSFYEQ